MTTDHAITNMNLGEILDEMFMVLTNKEKDVIVQRFSLDNKPRRTLESIGQSFSVTRERIRQIEKIALGKLKRTVQTTRLNLINEIANRLIEENGGVILDSEIVTKILLVISSDTNVDGNIIRLALNINPELERSDKTNTARAHWKKREIRNSLINKVISEGIRVLKKRSDVIAGLKLAASIRQTLADDIATQSDAFIVACLTVDKRLKKVGEDFGLMAWRHINPKSIRDKAYIILKDANKPLHFVEIANRIAGAGFDRKIVTTQAVHNELIRYDQFVLVGRGLYALKEFGYDRGTVADVIEALLAEKSPMTKQEIIEGVLKQRHVKKGTISLNLQKHPQFVRVGRAVYKLDLKRRLK